MSYNKDEDEKILVWSKEKGFSHQAVDSGENPGKLKRSPIIVPDGFFDKESVLRKFLEESKNLDSSVVDFVKEKLSKINAY